MDFYSLYMYTSTYKGVRELMVNYIHVLLNLDDTHTVLFNMNYTWIGII